MSLLQLTVCIVALVPLGFLYGNDVGARGVLVHGPPVGPDAASARAVRMALRWLKATQNDDGTWSTKPELGLTRGMDPVAGAGFAVLAFLSSGETPQSREFGPTVEKAINYLINSVYEVKDKHGNLAKDPNGNTPYVKMRGAGGSEYGFLIGTFALCEAYGMTGNPNVREAAEKTLARIISGQTPTGGWNYNLKCEPSEGAPDDISFGGWAMQALKASQEAGIQLPGMDECIKKAIKCIQTRNYSEKAGFVYRATNNHKDGGGGLAGAGCLAMQLFGYTNEPEVENALRVMADWQPSLDREYPYVKNGTRHNPQYYCYYASHCKYLAGMAKNSTPANFRLWKKWVQEMKPLYSKSIIIVIDKETNLPYTIKDANGKPRKIGHWVTGDHYNYDVMGTCLVTLQLTHSYYWHYWRRRRSWNCRPVRWTTPQSKAIEPEAESFLNDPSGEVDVLIDL